MDALPNLESYGKTTLLVLVSLVIVAIYQRFLAVKFPKCLLRYGQPPGKTGFSWRTRLMYYMDCDSLFREVYENYSSKGKTVLIPGLGFRKEVILPTSSMKWVLSQPDHILSHALAIIEVDGPKYSFGHDMYLTDPWQGYLVKTELNASLDNVCAAMNDELESAFDDYFGSETDSWREIDLLSTIRKIIGRASGRFTVGKPLCRDEDYIQLNYDIIDQTNLITGLTAASPRFLQPIVGRLAGWSADTRFKKLGRMIEPEYRRRLEILKHPKEDQLGTEPRDHFQMMMRFAQRERPTELANLDFMTRRLFLANFGSMHRTVLQTVNILLNVLESDAEHNTASMLRDEATRVLFQSDGGSDFNKPTLSWTKAKISKLVRADSVVRESMRLHSFDSRGVMRKVMTDGFTTQDGIPLPRGSVISFLGRPAQIEESRYENALKFDPFRFSRTHEAAKAQEANPASSKDGKVSAGLGTMSCVSTSSHHLPFGHGKYACPGRFLVDFELKMVLSYVITNYDMEFPPEYDGKRPSNVWRTEAQIPPEGIRIRVKRKQI